MIFLTSSKYDFDQVVHRIGTESIKWDRCEEIFGRKGLLPMWVADADWPSPPEIKEAFQRLLQHGIYGYSLPTDEHREIVVDFVKRHYQWTIEPEWILFTSGVVPSLHMAVKSFTNPGDEVVLQSPVYYPFYSAIKNQGAHVVNNPLKYIEGSYSMDFHDLEMRLTESRDLPASSSRIKMLILCSPHNPVGRVWDKEELLRLGTICKEHDILVVSDEIHGDLILSDKRHIPFSRLFPEGSITMISPSKTFNIPGLQIAVMIIPDLRLRSIFQEACTGVLKSGNTFALEALKVTYHLCDDWLQEEIQYLRENLDFALQWIERIPELSVVPPEGTYLLWLNCLQLFSDHTKIHPFFLDKARVALDEGRWFGEGGEGFMRLNFACPRSLLQKGLTRIERAINHL